MYRMLHVLEYHELIINCIFRWVLDTHVICHKESPSTTGARQITAEEWKSIQNNNVLIDSDVVNAQKLLIKERNANATRPVKKGTAKKSTQNEAASGTCKKSVNGSLLSSVTEKSVKVDKTKVLGTEDFFAKMLTKRAKSFK